jgi:hypothetical protein
VAGVRRLVPIALLVLLLAAPADAFRRQITRHGDLDGDPRHETVRVRPVLPPDAQTDFQRTHVRVADSCPGGDVNVRIAPIHDDLELMRLKRADLRRGSEVFLILRDGARSVLGEVRLVAWREASGQPCRRPKPLFIYDSDRHTRTPPGGTGDIASFTASIRDITRVYAGLEIAIDERFLGPSDPPSFGSLKKVTYWRYSPTRDRYVHYRTARRELPSPR